MEEIKEIAAGKSDNTLPTPTVSKPNLWKILALILIVGVTSAGLWWGANLSDDSTSTLTKETATDIEHLSIKEQVNRFYDQANAYSHSGEYRKAIAIYTKIIELEPSRYNYASRGYCYYRWKEYEKAIIDYNKVIKLDPYDATAYSNRGSCYRGLKKYEKAIDDVNKAIELDVSYPYSYNIRGYINLKLNQIENAEKDLTKSQELDAENEWLYRNWSIYYTAQKGFPKAIENLQKAIDLGYNDKEFLQEEELLDPLRSHPEFRRILNSMDD